MNGTRSRLVFATLVAVTFSFLVTRLEAVPEDWDCNWNSEFQWCGLFHVYNAEHIGGGASTEAFPEEDCEYATVVAESWFTGAAIENDTFDSDEATGYAESSSSGVPQHDTSFYGSYLLHTNHWYVGDPWVCGASELQMDRQLEQIVN